MTAPSRRRRFPLLVALLVALLAGAVGCSSADDGGSIADTVASGPDATVTDPSETAGRASSVDTSSMVERSDWGAVFADAGVDGTFVLHEVGSDEIQVYDPERAATRRIPASTFKILNSLIILETGTVADVDEIIEWDGVQRDVPAWNRDHDLRTAIEVSAVWVYQELARRVGEEAMSELVGAAGYGNADIGGGIDRFWLDGDLRISPLEQVDFLGRLVADDLPFSEENMAAVREIMVREAGDGWTWSHKTGTALSDDPVLGWLVGTTEYDGSTWIFAMNLDLGTVDVPSQIDPQVRQQITRTILEAEGALPPA
jgi:beta-lactamase class D